MAVSTVRKYFSLGGCGSPEITNASYGQINGSNEVFIGMPLGGTVLFLPVKWLKAKAIGATEKAWYIDIWESVLVLN